MADGLGCFVAGTMVHTKDGLKPVEAIQVGDVVVSQPQFTGEIGFRPVVDSFIVGERPIVEVLLQDRAGRTQTIRSTSCHPFWVKGSEWTAAEGLKSGDVLELHDRSEITVVGVSDTGEIEPVFNFTVDGFHTYYVGELGVWVHNASHIGQLGSGTNSGPFSVSFDQHLVGPDGWTNYGSLNGTHNMDNAIASLESRGLPYEIRPTGNGLSEISYLYERPNGNVYFGTKSVYDPAVFSDAEMTTMARQAGQDAWGTHQLTQATSIRTQVNGIQFQTHIHLSPTPRVATVYPVGY